MDTMKRSIFLSALPMISLLFLFGRSALAVENDCIQNRATAPAPYDEYIRTNPLKPTLENILAGKQLYQGGAKPFGCVPCHGILGKGKGSTARFMKVKPRDFSCQAMMKDIPDGQLFWVIRNGSQGTEMMSFKTLKDEQIWQIISYIKQFSVPHHQKIDLFAISRKEVKKPKLPK